MSMVGIRLISRIATFGAVSMCLAACSAGLDFEPGPAVSDPEVSLGQAGYSSEAPASYVLRPTDVIRINVFREEGLSVDAVALSASGEVSVPLVGSLVAAGMTPLQLETRIESLLEQRFLRDPDVSVNVVDYASHQVTVEGAVMTPGMFKFRPGTRLSGAISMARGATRVADINQIAVFRQTPQGMEVAKFDYQAVSSGRMLDPVLQPDDRVVVGTNSLSEFWQDVLKALPAFALFTQI